MKIIVKQGKYKVLPLSTFYALALPLLVLRFYLDIWFFPASYFPLFSLILAPPTMKFLIAVNQAWVNVELCLSIRLAIQSSVAPKISGSELEAMPVMTKSASLIAQRRKQMKLIEIGRICDAVFIAAFLLVSTVYFAILDSIMDDHSIHGFKEKMRKFEEVFQKYVLAQQILAFILLTTTVVTLICLIHKQSSLA